MLKNKKAVVLLTAALIGIFLMVSFLVLLNDGLSNKEPSINEISAIHMSYDYPVASDLEAMAKEADVIVLGTYTKFDSTWNMSRNPDNIMEESSEEYVEGRLYQFSVDEVLKGAISDDEIFVNHEFMRTVKKEENNAQINDEGIIIREATESREITFDMHDPRYIEPTLDVPYILFLNYEPDFNNYYGAIEPFSIKIVDGVADLQSNLVKGKKQFVENISVDGARTIQVETDAVAIKDKISGLTVEDVKNQIAAYKRS